MPIERVELRYTCYNAFITLTYSFQRIIGVIIPLFRREAAQALLNISKGLGKQNALSLLQGVSTKVLQVFIICINK